MPVDCVGGVELCVYCKGAALSALAAGCPITICEPCLHKINAASRASRLYAWENSLIDAEIADPDPAKFHTCPNCRTTFQMRLRGKPFTPRDIIKWHDTAYALSKAVIETAERGMDAAQTQALPAVQRESPAGAETHRDERDG